MLRRLTRFATRQPSFWLVFAWPACERERVTVPVQVTGVLLEQSQKRVELLIRPATHLGGFFQLTFHVNVSSATARSERATKSVCKREVKAEQTHQFRDLVRIYVDTRATDLV